MLNITTPNIPVWEKYNQSNNILVNANSYTAAYKEKYFLFIDKHVRHILLLFMFLKQY